jgi:ATP/maltotriose-dependent transcriptional regulator MalT
VDLDIRRGVREIGPTRAVSLLFSVLLGVWISRIIDQSTERAELIKELEAAQGTQPDGARARRRLTERFAAETCLDLDLDMSRGETMLAPPVAARLVSRMQAPAVEALTPGEVEVLAALARGLSNGEIGRELHVGEATVKTNLLRAFAKLGVDERTRAVTVAMERGILPSPRQT